MADVVYGILQKPLVERLVDAACIYWEVGPEYFRGKGHGRQKDGGSERRWTLYYLLREDAVMDMGVIGTQFGISKQGVSQGIEAITFRKGNSSSIRRDIENIRKIAGALEAKVIVVNVKLEQFLPGHVAERENGD